MVNRLVESAQNGGQRELLMGKMMQDLSKVLRVVCYQGPIFEKSLEANLDKTCDSSMMSFINMGSAMLAVVAMGYLPMSSVAAFATVMAVFFMVAEFFSVKTLHQMKVN